MRDTDRTRPTVLREIAEIERYLVDVPPHSGGGHRDALIAKLSELRRELATFDARDPEGS